MRMYVYAYVRVCSRECVCLCVRGYVCLCVRSLCVVFLSGVFGFLFKDYYFSLSVEGFNLQY